MQNRRTFIRSVFLVGAGAMALPAWSHKSDDYTKLVIVHTNDIHCHFEPFPDTDPKFGGRGGLNRIAAYVKQLRAIEPELLLLDCGDFSQGTPYYNFFGSEVILKLMTAMKYNASVIGNHEYDNGLKGLEESLQLAGFPMLSSNYDFSNTILKGKVQQNIVLEKKGLRIGIYALGIELDGLVQKINYEGTIYQHPLQIALEQEEYLRKKQQCDFVICLSHLGLSYKTQKISDMDIAANTYYTDLILGGHTHTFLDEPIEKVNKRGDPVIINQVGWGSLMMGYLEFNFEKKKKLQINNAVNKPVG